MTESDHVRFHQCPVCGEKATVPGVTDHECDPDMPPPQFTGFLAGVPLEAAVAPPFSVEDMFARIEAVHDKLPPRPAEIKLTQEQLDRIPVAEPAPSWMGAQIGNMLGIPIRIVEDYWQSAVGQRQLEELKKAIEEEAARRDPVDYVFDQYGPYLTDDWWTR
jgi:hypothetical protein